MTPDPSNIPAANPRRRAPWQNVLLYLAIWLVVLFVLVWQTSWGFDLTSEQARIRVLRDWGPWFFLGPLLWWLVRKFPLFGQKKFRHLGVHLLASILMVGLAEAMVAFLIFPATQPAMEKAAISDRDLIRELRGSRPRPVVRTQEYRLRPKKLGQKVQIWLLLYWVFALIGTAVVHRRSAEDRARRALALQNDLSQARFRELQSRLNPHFLFNSLNSIAALIPEDPERAEEMVTRLSALLRRVLASSEQALISLGEELELVREYLAIEQVRFSDRLSVEEEVEKVALSSRLPPLTLQPIAENAIKHGIEPKREPSLLRIMARVTDSGKLEIRIVDDGVGFTESESRSGLGMGLENVKDRLENAFPGEAHVSLEHPEAEGTEVVITIPGPRGKETP